MTSRSRGLRSGPPLTSRSRRPSAMSPTSGAEATSPSSSAMTRQQSPSTVGSSMGPNPATTTAKGQRILSSGYGAALRWCLRCDVGWMNKGECFNCGKADQVWRWTSEKGMVVWKQMPEPV